MNLFVIAGAIGPWQIVLIVALALLLFGGKKIPELMKGLGQGMKEFKKAARELSADDDKDAETPPKKEGNGFAHIDIDVPFKIAKQKLVDEFEAITEPGSAADLLHGLVIGRLRGGKARAIDAIVDRRIDSRVHRLDLLLQRHRSIARFNGCRADPEYF